MTLPISTAKIPANVNRNPAKIICAAGWSPAIPKI